MNKIYIYLSLIFSIITSYCLSQSAGDLAFVHFNADGDDDFAVVVLANIPASTTFFFSDNEPNSDGSSFTTGEGQIQWVTPNYILYPGTVVTFTDTDNDGNANFGTDVCS